MGKRIGVIGGGAFGTALAQSARASGHDVLLWARESEVVAAINRDHVNPVFLPSITLDPGLRATADLAEAAEADVVLLVPPSQHLRGVATTLRDFWKPGVPAVICSKGIEQGTLRLMTEVLSETLPEAPVAVLSGPTFAIDLAQDKPSAITLSCASKEIGAELVALLGRPTLRPYLSEDLVGPQIGGALKNVIAIACGIVAGKELGDNARAALITRGLSEMVRLGVAKGARPETMMGLSGIGDLVLTCAGLKSRNMTLGMALGRGEKLEAILGARKSVAEGVYTASAAVALAGHLGLELPIVETMDRILNAGEDVDEAIADLLARPFKHELTNEDLPRPRRRRLGLGTARRRR